MSILWPEEKRSTRRSAVASSGGRSDINGPLGRTDDDRKEGSDGELPERVEMEVGKENVLAEESEVEVVLPAVHLHSERFGGVKECV